MSNPSVDLDQLREQRDALAARVRLPWWYMTTLGVAYGLMFAAPFAVHYLPVGVGVGMALAAALVIFGAEWLHGHVSGVRLPWLREITYPSNRPGAVVGVVTIVGAMLGEVLLLADARVFAAGALAVGAIAACEGCLVWGTVTTRKDIRQGRAGSR